MSTYRPLLASSLAALLAIAAPAAQALNIVFDYSLDNSGFFTADKRNTLDQVASIFENNLGNHRAAINNATFMLPEFTYDGDGPMQTYSGTGVFAKGQSLAADEVRIYVGARDLADSTLGLAWVGTLDGNKNGSFSGWGGAMLFDTTADYHSLDQSYQMQGKPNPYGKLTPARDWYFDSDIRSAETMPSWHLPVDPARPNDAYFIMSSIDFASVAMHELGHVFGLDHSLNPGDTMYGSTSGSRQLFTTNDWAAMASGGWQVGSRSPDLNTVVTMAVPTPVPEPASLVMMLAGLLGMGAAVRRRR